MCHSGSAIRESTIVESHWGKSHKGSVIGESAIGERS
jgi:hypothetical protein